MGLKYQVPNINYLEEDTGVNTRINIFKYKRTRPNEKIKSQQMCFITLPLPVNMPNDTYNMSIQDLDLGLVGNLTNVNLSGLENADITTIKNTVKEALDKIDGESAARLGLVGLATAPLLSDVLSRKTGLSIAEAAQAEAGIVRNPHTALLFQNVRLRTFTFTWQLSPRSINQSRNLNSIISTIKQAMHPDIDLGGFALNYPDLFTVSFNNDKEGIVNVDTSFLEDFSVNPTPNGHAYYKNGYPVEVQMSMTFKEIAIKTSETYFKESERLGFASPGVRD